jgi:hypothetical protein
LLSACVIGGALQYNQHAMAGALDQATAGLTLSVLANGRLQNQEATFLYEQETEVFPG